MLELMLGGGLYQKKKYWRSLMGTVLKFPKKKKKRLNFNLGYNQDIIVYFTLVLTLILVWYIF